MANEGNLTILEQLRRGINLARSGDREGAAALFEAVLAQRPDHEEALVWKAAVVNDPDEAVRCLELALKLNPSNQRARVGLEWAYKRQKTGNGELEAEKSVPLPEPASRPEMPPSAPRSEATFQPGVHNTASLRNRAQIRPENETKPEDAPYKKSRLAGLKAALPSVELPPEALPWTRTNRQAQKKADRPTRPDLSKESQVFRAANPPVAFRVAPQVSSLNQKGSAEPLRLRWALLAFGLALGLTLLSFLFSGLAPLLGSLALLAAVVGVVMFNRARY